MRTLVVRATILQRVLVLDVARDPLTGRPSWPDGARFAFTIFDDTTDMIHESDTFVVITEQVCF